MVHRDVKPGNLFLEAGDDPAEPHVRVLDFGIAQLSDEAGTLTHLTEFGRSPFSPAYASPEQLEGGDAVGPPSDVFSLGAVGYHMLTGVRPFTAADPARMRGEVAESVRTLGERVPQLSPAVHASLVRALAPAPRERFPDAAVFAEALAGIAVPLPAPVFTRAATPTPVAAAARASVPDYTRLQTVPPPPRPAPPRPQLAAAVSYEPAEPVIVVPPTRISVAAPAAARNGQPAEAKRPGVMRRFFHALWELSVTLFVLALFAAAWAVAGIGIAEGERDQLYGGAAATMLLTPLAIHRLTGRRGSFGMGVIGATLATAAAFYYMRGAGDPALVLLAMFGLQVVVCFLMARITRRRAPEPYPGL
jgi:hypothetical protein